MTIGFLGKQNDFALEMLRRLQWEHPKDKFSAWQLEDKAPSTELEVIFAFGKVDAVGLGGIGDLLIERLRGFGMILTGVDNHPEHAPNGVKGYGHDELKLAAADADYLVLAIPGTKDNENMIDGAVLAALKKNAVLVNIGRGTLVDEAALLAAVKSGHLHGAVLDVVKNEPVSEGNPLLMEPRIFVTPHIAGATDLMLDGTVSYLGNVLAEFRQGLCWGGIASEPGNSRVPLRNSMEE